LGGVIFEESYDGHLQSQRQLLQRLQAGRSLAVLDHAQRVDIQPAEARQVANGKDALRSDLAQPLPDIHYGQAAGCLALQQRCPEISPPPPVVVFPTQRFPGKFKVIHAFIFCKLGQIVTDCNY
jgi:hypothetical protein